jgi:hypothetical protein
MPAGGRGGRGLPASSEPFPLSAVLPIPPVLTDRGGKFVILGLEEGAYRLAVVQNGYVNQEYGQRVFPGQGTLINLVACQSLTNLNLLLTRTGGVSGRLVDGNGQPAVAVPMQILRATYNAYGQRILQNAGTTRTNDRGEYRFYWVTPGRYYVAGGSAAATYGVGGEANSLNELGERYSLTYYPGASDGSRAIPLEVRPGSELVADFLTPKQQLYTVSGRILDSSSTTLPAGTFPNVTLSLAFQTLNGSSVVLTVGQGYDPVTGNFQLRDVLPGSYFLQIAAPPATAHVPIEVKNSNVEGVVATVDSGVTINGRFMSEGGQMPPANTLRLQLRPVSATGSPMYFGFSPAAQATADGSFNLAGVFPGNYRAIVIPSQDFYVKGLRYDRRDALNSVVEVSRRNSDGATIEVVISRNVAQIDGVVTNDNLQPVPGVQAVLVPDTANRNRTELYKTATTDQSGRFSMRGIAPGDYKLFAWEALENFGYFDPDVLRRSEALGKAVQLSEGSKLVAETRVISAMP